ncbi:hypothetical protein Mth01_15680 [Sphaerimonospora thailandensis]|uniref:Uncharacterized protein n=1 Tax=Sphaerimonospora thailandensis TaxID=795644 RepID=A0A8J3R7L4_9ACTN|nr:hypothetical protein Mth01_15680 [Sphaerimonospora thailandensis]
MAGTTPICRTRYAARAAAATGIVRSAPARRPGGEADTTWDTIGSGSTPGSRTGRGRDLRALPLPLPGSRWSNVSDASERAAEADRSRLVLADLDESE